MKRILFVCPSSGVGGAETFIKQTFSHGNRDSFENHYLLFSKGPLYDWLTEQGAFVHLLSQQPRLSSNADRKRVKKKLKDLINQYNFSLIHSTMAYGALFVARVCKQMNVPHVWFQHGPASGWMDRLAALLPHQGLIVNSHYTGRTQRQLENPLRFLIPRCNPIEKILLGTDSTPRDQKTVTIYKNQLLTSQGLDNEYLLIGMMCRVQKWKGVHIFLEALKIISNDKSLPQFMGVVWGNAFKDENYLNDLKKKASSEKIPVIFPGHADDPFLSLSTCDIVVNASIQPEPFGFSIIEGMMAGAVPVVPDEGGPMEIIKNGTDGLLFKARNPESLAKQLKTLLIDSELREKLQDNAKSSAQQKYTAERAIGHLEKFHQKIMG